jgi:hypothetical protein
MGADHRRTRSFMTTGLVTLLALGLSAPALGAKTPPSGSSCAHPVVVTLHRGQKAVGYRHQIIIAAEPQLLVPGVRTAVEWWGWSGPGAEDTDIICSARIQRSDGSWVGPTRLKPYATPTPMGGEYDETTDPNTQYRQVVVKFAKSPVPRGASCNYPLMSRAGNSETRDPSAVFRVDTPRPGMDEVAVTIHNPNIVVCRATAFEEAEPATIPGSTFEFVRSLPITVGEHGGLSSPLPRTTQPANFLAVRVYSRYLHLPKPSPPKPTHGCTLETSGGNTGAEALGHPTAGQPVELVAVITIHKSGITVCSATLTGMVPIPGAFGSHGEQLYKEVTYPMTVSPHGGRSRPVTVPWEFYVPQAHVKARRG